MPFDGIVTNVVTQDLKQLLIGGRINKIYQPTNSELIFMIRKSKTNYSLLISIHPNYARMHLTEVKLKNPAEPPMFCMVLRKHLQSALIEDIEQIELERIISFRFQAMNEIGDRTTKTLMVEIMGRHSNIILLNESESKIVDCIKHVPPFQNRYRSLLPGADYKLPPPQYKLNILKEDAATIVRKLDFNAGKLDKQFVRLLTGISTPVGKEIVHRTNLGSSSMYVKTTDELQNEIKHKQFYPTIYQGTKGKRKEFHVIKLTHLDEQKQFSNVHHMLDAFFSNKAERDRIEQQAKDLIRLLQNELTKNKRKLNIHKKTLKKAKKCDELQKKGELLTANLHVVNKGDESITVIDYYDPDQNKLIIPLVQDKTPSENAQAYFKKYRKLQAGQEMAKKEIVKTKAEIAYIEDVLVQIENARDEDIEDIREELQEGGYIKKQKKKKRKVKKPQPERFTSTDGTTIYVGRNNKQNEYVTTKIANRNDIWLHTLNIPGSHVVIRSESPSENTLHEAALLAAFFSKARQSASVPVDYTKVKHVKKPTGAKPGFVTYTDQKTLYVTPNEKAIKQLKKDASSS